jgi:uncharacterized protein YcbK (DUF882 family)
VKLTRHFDTREFRSKDGATWIPSYKRAELERLCADYLEPLRDRFGPVSIMSGFRTAEHNRNVGGAGSSYHTHVPGRRGAAADVTCAKGTPTDWYAFLDRLGAPGLGIYPGHVHVDNRVGRARW